MLEPHFRFAFLLLLVAVISATFLAMIRPFLLTLVLAAVFAGVAYPTFRWIAARFRGRESLAAVATLLLFMLVVIVPLLSVLGAAANEALRLGETLRPRFQRFVQEPGQLDRWLQSVPGYRFVEPYRQQILTSAGEVVAGAGALIVAALTAMTRATVTVVFHFFVMLYTMFFFLTDGPRLLRTTLTYLPVANTDKTRMIDKFVSVARATLKGTLLIGAAQGTLAGLAFWVVGIDGAIFWGTVMTLLSIIPGVGGAIIWVPAAIILVATGSLARGIGLAAFCAAVVGSVDNLLRPRLVGRDTQMHELLIFFSTLGGLLLFGPLGFILGPILAALFLTSWEMFNTAYRGEIAGPAAVASPDPLSRAAQTADQDPA